MYGRKRFSVCLNARKERARWVVVEIAEKNRNEKFSVNNGDHKN